MDRAGKTNDYRLESEDSDFGDDRTPDGRTNLRLHHPGLGITVGCISVCTEKEWDSVGKIIGNTATGSRDVDSKSLLGRIFGSKESLKEFGSLNVLPAGASLSFDAKTGVVSLSVMQTGSRIACAG